MVVSMHICTHIYLHPCISTQYIHQYLTISGNGEILCPISIPIPNTQYHTTPRGNFTDKLGTTLSSNERKTKIWIQRKARIRIERKTSMRSGLKKKNAKEKNLKDTAEIHPSPGPQQETCTNGSAAL